MRKITGTVFAALILFSCNTETQRKKAPAKPDKVSRTEINETLDKWHQAAARADFEAYFSKMAEDAVYIGTDATENWDLEEFMAFAKPYFHEGKAWAFYDVDRNIYFSEDKKIVWFDELLKTQMGLCRGSGVLSKENGEWKIKHYVLSMTIPNDRVEEVVSIKEDFDQYYAEKIFSGR